MDCTGSIVPWRSKRHPVFRLVREDGRSLAWLARKIGYSHGHVRSVASGSWPAVARFRAACVALLGGSEHDLFDHGDGSSAAPPKEGEIVRAATATRPRYATAPVLSTLEEAPSTKSA
jgi:hypothetical protein